MLVKVVVLTGAGISAESGLATFRDADGLWQGHHVDNVATPEAFHRDPATVHRFYDDRRRELRAVVPNPAHIALARLEQVLGDELLVVTQNVDDLHERAGSRRPDEARSENVDHLLRHVDLHRAVQIGPDAFREPHPGSPRRRGG